MERRYYFIYGPNSLEGVSTRLFVGYIRITEIHGQKHASVVKATIQQVSANSWRTIWNVPELHYQYPLINTFDTVAHDALQRAYEEEGAENYSVEYFPYLS